MTRDGIPHGAASWSLARLAIDRPVTPSAPLIGALDRMRAGGTLQLRTIRLPPGGGRRTALALDRRDTAGGRRRRFRPRARQADVAVGAVFRPRLQALATQRT